MPKERCLRCDGKKTDPEYKSDPCRVCGGSGERQSDVVLNIQSIRMEFNAEDLLFGNKERIKQTIE
jgi:DnaJ-class molecular chaperone